MERVVLPSAVTVSAALPSWDTFDSESEHSAEGGMPSPRSDASADLSIYRTRSGGSRGAAARPLHPRVASEAHGRGTGADLSSTFSDTSVLMPDGAEMRARLSKLHARFHGSGSDGAAARASTRNERGSDESVGSGGPHVLPSLDAYMNAAASSAHCDGAAVRIGASKISPKLRSAHRSAMPLGELRNTTNHVARGDLRGPGVWTGAQGGAAPPAVTCSTRISFDSDAATATAQHAQGTNGVRKEHSPAAVGVGVGETSPTAVKEKIGLEAEKTAAPINAAEPSSDRTIADVKARAYASMNEAFMGQLSDKVAEAADAAISVDIKKKEAATSESVRAAETAEAVAATSAAEAVEQEEVGQMRATAISATHAAAEAIADVKTGTAAASQSGPTLTSLAETVDAARSPDAAITATADDAARKDVEVIGGNRQDPAMIHSQLQSQTQHHVQHLSQQTQTQIQTETNTQTQKHTLAQAGEEESAEMLCDVASTFSMNTDEHPPLTSELSGETRHYGEEQEFWKARRANLNSLAAQIPGQEHQQQQQQQQQTVREQQVAQLHRQQRLKEVQQRLDLQDQQYEMSAENAPPQGPDRAPTLKVLPVTTARDDRAEDEVIANMAARIDTIGNRLDALLALSSTGDGAHVQCSGAAPPRQRTGALGTPALDATDPELKSNDGPDVAYDAVAERIQQRVNQVLGILQISHQSDELGSGNSPFGALKRMLDEEASREKTLPETPVSSDVVFSKASSPYAREQASSMLSALEESINQLLAAIRANERGRARAYKLGLEKLQQAAAVAQQGHAQATQDAVARAESEAAVRFVAMQQKLQDELRAETDAHAATKATSEHKLSKLNDEIATLRQQLDKKNADQQHEIEYELYKQRKAFEEEASASKCCEEDLRAQHNAELETLRATTAAELAQVQSDMRAEIELWTSRARAGEQRAIKVHSELMEQHGQQLSQLKQAHEQALATIRSKTTTLHEEHDAYVKGLREQHAVAIEQIQQQQLSAAQEDRERLEKRLTKVHVEEMRSTTEQHAIEIGRAGAQIAQLQRDLNRATNKLSTRETFRGKICSGISDSVELPGGALEGAAGITVLSSSPARRNSGNGTDSDGTARARGSTNLAQTSADMRALVTRIRSRVSAAESGASSAGSASSASSASSAAREQSPRRDAPKPLAMPTRRSRSRLHSPTPAPSISGAQNDHSDDITPVPQQPRGAADLPGASALANLDSYLASTGVRDDR